MCINFDFKGDSGGSIFVQDTLNNKTKYIAVGIVSYGDSCAVQNEPGSKKMPIVHFLFF